VIQPNVQSLKPKVDEILPEVQRQEPAADVALARARGWALKSLVSAALYVLIFYYWVDLESILRLLASSDVKLVVLGVVLYCLGQLTSAYRWLLLLQPVGLSSSYTRLAAAYFIGMFFNIFLPTIVGGDAVKAVLLARETGSPARATISVFMDRNVGLLALLTIACLAAWYTPAIAFFGMSLFAFAALVSAAYVAANLLLASARTYGTVDRLIALTPLAGMRHRASSLYEALLPYRRHAATLAAALALSFLHQAVVISVVFLNARALGQTVPISALAAFVPLISLAGMLPVAMNGMGVREALYVLLFGRLGVSQDVSVSLALLYLVVTFIASLPGGIVYALLQTAPARLEGKR